MSFVMQSEDDEQVQAWEHFYTSVCNVLQRFGTENHFGEADYLLSTTITDGAKHM